MTLKDFTLGEISQSQEDRYCRIPLYDAPFTEMERGKVAVGGRGEDGEKVLDGLGA
jgi:hypothetical protein